MFFYTYFRQTHSEPGPDGAFCKNGLTAFSRFIIIIIILIIIFTKSSITDVRQGFEFASVP